MEKQPPTILEFGSYRLDVVRRLLFNSGNSVDLTPKVFDMLALLVENRSRVVEKKELMDALWPDSYVEDSKLFQNISTLRKTLGENPQDHQYIVTIPGRGYRFVAPVRAVANDEAGIAEQTTRSITIHEPPEANTPLVATTIPSASPLRGKLVVVLITVVAVSLAVFAVRKLSQYRVAPPSFSNLKVSLLTTSGKIVTAAISPDGRDYAFVTTENGKESLSIKQVSTASRSVEIVPPEDVNYHSLTFSPDGNYIYYVNSGENGLSSIYRVPALGGASIALAQDVDSSVTLSPDGKWMSYVRGYPDQKESALMVAESDGSGERKLAALKDPNAGFVFGSGPAWSPDGKTIATAGKHADETGEYQTVLNVSLGDGRVSPIGSARWQRVGRVAWVGEGNALIVSASQQESGISQVWHLSYPGGEVRQLTNDLIDYQNVTITRNSRQISALASDSQANLWTLPAKNLNSAPVQITGGNYDGLNGLVWTPDGRVIFSVYVNGGQNLSVVDRDGRNSKQLTSTNGVNRTAAVSPDGRYIVFASDRSGALHLWRTDADGSNPIELTHGVSDADPDFTPDGKWIVYRSYKNGNPNLFRISLEGGDPAQLSDRISGPPQVSPDGKLIACAYRETALTPQKLALISVEGGTPVKLFEFPALSTAYKWTSEGSAITYIRTVAGVSNFWRQPIDGSPAQQLTQFTSDLIFAADWSVDGNWIVYSKGNRSRDVILLSGN